jgi:hypothetical protein
VSLVGLTSVGLTSVGLTFGAVRIVVILLAAAAALAWPGGGPGVQSVRVLASGRALPASGEDLAGAEAGPGPGAPSGRRVDAGGGAEAEAGVVRSVPAADVAGVIDLLALTLRSGAGLVEAMEAVAARVGGPLGLHLRTVAAASRWGVEDAMAWASVPSAWQPAAIALRMATSAGVPPADALVGAAEEVRRAEQQRLEVATATLGVRIVLPLGLVFLPAFILTTVVPIVLALAQQVLSSP